MLLTKCFNRRNLQNELTLLVRFQIGRVFGVLGGIFGKGDTIKMAGFSPLSLG